MEKLLPLSFSSFEKIVTNNCLYVDKTKYIYDLFYKKRYDYVFLSRPRRFGKTLFTDTLKQLFLGNKELFKDLWIYNSDYDWQVYPIIHLDFSTVNKRSVAEIDAHLVEFLHNCADRYGVELKYYQSFEGKFSYLIGELAKINKVVILIDEYDKPILDNLDDVDKAVKIRDLLKSFYEVVKGHDSDIRAFFMTGINRFDLTSIFSGLNNLNDISKDAEYLDILGFTQQELESHFADYIEKSSNTLNLDKEFLLRQIRSCYGGYKFSNSEQRIYNPSFILDFFITNIFVDYHSDIEKFCIAQSNYWDYQRRF